MHGGGGGGGGTTERPGRLYLKAFLSAMSMMPLLDVGSQQYVVDGFTCLVALVVALAPQGSTSSRC